MTTTHHPTDETLHAYATGALDLGRRVVIAAHIELCPSCGRLLRAIDRMSGRQLDRLEPTPLRAEALPETLSLAEHVAPFVKAPPKAASDLPVALTALKPYTLGPWKWIGPGVRWRSASVPANEGARVFLLKAAPGTRLPHHTHTGTELTLILSGAFAHIGGRYGIGDLDEADGSIEHQPIVEPGAECVCLVAMDGELRLVGPFARLLQPFVRM